jgi:hypothetical protein
MFPPISGWVVMFEMASRTKDCKILQASVCSVMVDVMHIRFMRRPFKIDSALRAVRVFHQSLEVFAIGRTTMFEIGVLIILRLRHAFDPGNVAWFEFSSGRITSAFIGLTDPWLRASFASLVATLFRAIQPLPFSKFEGPYLELFAAQTARAENHNEGSIHGCTGWCNGTL